MRGDDDYVHRYYFLYLNHLNSGGSEVLAPICGSYAGRLRNFAILLNVKGDDRKELVGIQNISVFLTSSRLW